MTTPKQVPHGPGVPASVIAELSQRYLHLRGSYAEALTRARTESEFTLWQDRTTRMKRFWLLLDRDDLSEVLGAVAAVQAAQQAADICIATQIAVAQRRPVAG